MATEGGNILRNWLSISRKNLEMDNLKENGKNLSFCHCQKLHS